MKIKPGEKYKPLPKKIDPRDLAFGTKIEMEHTKDKAIARKIAIDHLKEHFTYYRYLPIAEQIMPVAKKRKRVVREVVPQWQTLPPNWY
jgi:hypothetical protein